MTSAGMTQNTTKNDKREQRTEILFNKKKIYSVWYPVPPAHAPAPQIVFTRYQEYARVVVGLRKYAHGRTGTHIE